VALLVTASEMLAGTLLRWQAEANLRVLNEQLEGQVRARTGELRATVQQLQREVSERKQAQDALRATTDSLEQRLAERTEELAAFFDLTVLSSREVEISEVIEQVLPRMVEVTRSRAVCIHRLDEEGETLQLAGEQNLPPDLLGALLEVEISPAFRSWLAQPNDPLVSTEMAESTGLPHALQLPGYASYLCAQVRAGAQALGILSCYRYTARGFSVDEVALITALAEQVGLLLETDRLRSEAQAKAVLEERHRLARDLHDSVTQSLYSLSLLSRAAREALRAGDTEHLDYSLTELELDTLHALREMRLLLYELRPANLESAGLVAALQFRLDTVERRAGLQIDFDLDDYAPVAPALEVEVYYIVVEALNNVVKHAAASRVQVRLAHSDKLIQIRVADDGVGYDTRRTGQGLGLRSIRERVARLNGRLTIAGEPTAGAVVEVEFPLKGEAVA
jgi:signal transduction histidine kinase